MSNNKFDFSIVTFNQKSSFKIKKLYIKTINGYATFLRNHADLLTVVQPSKGFFEIKDKTSFKINNNGILSIKNGKVKLLIDNIIIYS